MPLKSVWHRPSLLMRLCKQGIESHFASNPNSSKNRGFVNQKAANIASTRRRFAACWWRKNALTGSFLWKVFYTQSQRR
jgi:hypothetical protein